jgi:ABC-2 type transport system permease protein
MKILKAIKQWFVDLARVFAVEISVIIHDEGALLFFLGLPLLYPIVYTLVYNNEVVRDIPVAVVDYDHTTASRKLARMVDASPSIEVYDNVPNMGDARALMAEGKVYGILEIPKDYAKNIGRGSQANATFYSEMSLLLRYRTTLGALTELQVQLASDITADRSNAAGLAGQSLSGAPLSNVGQALGDAEQGFASFIMPGIVVLILQQSMVLGIALIAGTRREKWRAGHCADLKIDTFAPASSTVLGRGLCYAIFYIPATIYILHYIPEMFSLPHYGSAVDYLLFAFPLLLGSAMFGQTLSAVIRDRESAFMVLVFTSVVFLFLSGLTWPRYAMPRFWLWLGDIVPATWGVEGFIRINSNGATLAESARPYEWMWILTVFYFVTSWLICWYWKVRRANKFPMPAAAPSVC